MNWQNLRPAGTHHVYRDEPAYQARFDEVLAFHAPGLAPVRRGAEAWHIHPDGQAAYACRFQRTFGFYEGLAAVISADGWHHIHPGGTDAYPQRYAWCGNFQGGRCSVRQDDGRYMHINTAGKPVYAARWAYAGDFRDGSAVVQGDNGYATHIDTNGELLHGCWFLDLDVFHKGFARARDAGGWLHVDASGQPIYQRRFAAVEPFYNGQARVECHDGGLKIINERGDHVQQLRPALRSEFAALSADMVGFWRTQTIATAVKLGIFAAVPGRVEDIAARCAIQTDKALRLLRALAELNLLMPTDNIWDCTPRGAYLRADHPLSLASAAREYGADFPSLWENLPAALQGSWEPRIFDDVAQDAARCAGHHQMLRSYARHDYAAVADALALCGNEHIIDAGGGLGVLADGLLQHYPDVQVTLLERPEVIAQVRVLCSAPPRLSYLAADIFAPWPVHADAVVLARVLHDWDDAHALRILQQARATLAAGGRLFIVEMLLTDENPGGSLCDLHVLMTTGGQERRLGEYQALLAQAGFAYVALRRLPALPVVIVGEAQ